MILDMSSLIFLKENVLDLRVVIFIIVSGVACKLLQVQAMQDIIFINVCHQIKVPLILFNVEH